MVVRLVIGLVMTVLAGAASGRRAFWFYSSIRSGRPADDRFAQLNEQTALLEDP